MMRKLSVLTSSACSNESKKEFEGFDFLRAFFSIAIIAYKTNIFYIPEILKSTGFTYYLSAYVLSGMVGALAVPVFLQISLFLFYCKSETMGLRYFIQKRLPRLLSLYLFWVGLITVFDILFIGGFESLKLAVSSPKSFVYFIVSGNSTPYFFFFSLVFITILAQALVLLFSKVKSPSTQAKISYSLLLFSSSLLIFLSTVDQIIQRTGTQSPVLNFISSLAHWDYTPVNFLPYVFTAAIAAQDYKNSIIEEKPKSLREKLPSFFLLATLFFVLEVSLTGQEFLIQVDQAPLDHYLRLSLVFASWLLLYVALLSKRSVPTIIRFISKCSLGIYGFHVFFTFRGLPPFISTFQLPPVLEIIVTFLATLVGSILLTLLIKKNKRLKNFV